MRLTCPSCGAQYEVPPEAIPPTGRDVQCSACQHSWFERGSAPPPRLLDPEPWDSLPRAENDDEEADDLADFRAAPPPQAPPRPRVDPEVSRILREEAQREAEARAVEQAGRTAIPASAAEDAPPEIAPRPTPPRRLHARDTGDAAAPAPAPEGVPAPAPVAATPRPSRASRPAERELDLDQINSTLRSESEQAPERSLRGDPSARSSSGFGRGFLGAILLLALLAALYVLRPQITAAVPASAGVLDPYADGVDAGRDWLNRQVGRLLGAEPSGAE